MTPSPHSPVPSDPTPQNPTVTTEKPKVTRHVTHAHFHFFSVHHDRAFCSLNSSDVIGPSCRTNYRPLAARLEAQLVNENPNLRPFGITAFLVDASLERIQSKSSAACDKLKATMAADTSRLITDPRLRYLHTLCKWVKLVYPIRIFLPANCSMKMKVRYFKNLSQREGAAESLLLAPQKC